jgi:hypothetical protein
MASFSTRTLNGAEGSAEGSPETEATTMAATVGLATAAVSVVLAL